MQVYRQRWMIWLVAIALVAGACTSGGDKDESSPAGVPGDRSEGTLRVRLSEGEAAPITDTPVRLVTGQALDPDRVGEIVAGLPPLSAEDDDQQETNFPAQTMSPPVVGETITQAFPPATDGAGQAPAVPTGPLQVLRHQPAGTTEGGNTSDGDDGVVPFISVTFSQPMVSLATLDQLDEVDVPVVIEPDLPGRWRWIGTQTARFEHDPEAFDSEALGPDGGDDPTLDRLPMATEYTVTVPAGTTSANGAALAEAVSWSFRTPPARVTSLTPMTDALPLAPVFVAVFDQIVDPDAVVSHVVVTAGGDRHPMRLATAAEIEADDQARQATSQALAGRWVAFRPADPFVPDEAIEITFPAGLPSAEGPRVSETEQSFSGRTYPRFAISEVHCGWDGRCQPGQEFQIEFTTPIDLDTFDQSTITSDPEIPGLVAHANRSQIVVRGDTRAGTTYRLTVSDDLRDVFGQRLDGDRHGSVTVGDASPVLRFESHQPLVTVDPLADRATIGVSTIGHDELRVRTYAADASRWGDYRSFLQRRRDDFTGMPSGWSLLRDETISTEPDVGQFGETTIDLSPELGTPGHVVVVIEPVATFERGSQEYWMNQPVVVWAQRTSIGVDALVDHGQVVVWATDLRTGAPLSDVSVSIAGGRAATTGGDGLATLTSATSGGNDDHLVARRGDDTALLVGWEFTNRNFSERQDIARWHVFDDRGLYRPGETARLKGWVRRLTLSGDAQLAPIDSGATITWTAHDAFGNQIATGDAPVSRLGGFDLSVDVPAEASLGQGWVEFRLEGATGLQSHSHHHHQLHLAEFRRPEFEVTAEPESAGPYLVTQPATLGVSADYLSGGPLANAPVTWSVRIRPGTYSPPRWKEFTFGVWEPWWPIPIDGGGSRAPMMAVDVAGGFWPPIEEEVATFSGLTNAAGQHFLRVDFEGAPEGQPVVVSANAAVTDVNRQQLADTTDLLVHASSLYVGLRSDRTFVNAGSTLPIEVIVTDIDGEVVSGQSVTVTSERMESELVDGEWQEVPIPSETCAVTSADEPVECEITPDVGGRYRVTAAVTDPAGGTNTTVLTRWVSGQGRSMPQRSVEAENLTLVPSAETYADGDTAEVMVQAPFAEGTGLMVLARNGITTTETFEVTNGGAVLSVPIRADQAPGLELIVEAVGVAPRDGDAVEGEDPGTLPPRPAYAVGALRLDVPPASRTLDVSVTPADAELTPGSNTSVTIEVVDAAGRPAADAELAVAVVDEAVLSLTDYQLADPLATMYAPIDSYIAQLWGRRSILLSRPSLFGNAEEQEAADEAAGGAMSGGYGDDADAAPDAIRSGFSATAADGGSAPGSISVRTNFDALVVFDPEVTTDAQGRATVEVPLADNLTRYRVMVTAAVGAGDFGTGEANITARLPVQARPSAPRFLNYGDAFELPVVVHNQTGEAVAAEVVVEATNLALDESSARIEVPAGDRVEVRFPAAAAEPGTARIRTTVVAGSHGDSSVIELPVFTPATSEAFATYGVIDEGGVRQPLATPEGVIGAFGGLDVSLSSTSLQTLTDTVLHLVDYPYDHVDAYASRVLAIVALRDVLEAFAVEGLPSATQLNERVATDLAEIARLQNDDGGFGIWTRSGHSDPYRSIQATHALVAARDAGYAPDASTVAMALDHLQRIDQVIPAEWPDYVKAMLEAYALHVRFQAGDHDQAAADRLFDQWGDQLKLDALGVLWPVVSADRGAAIATIVANRVNETPSAASFTTSYDEGAHLVLASDRRTDGIVLDAMIRMQPDSDLIPKVVTGLIGNQRRGTWRNVQENSFILLALKRYFDTYESATPDFVARVWLGDLYAAEVPHQGRSVDTALTHVPMADLLGRDDPALVVTKDGTGRLYYRLGLRYAPENLRPDARDEGFVVDRMYEAIDDDSDVTRNPDGTWRIKAGANVRVVVTMVADGPRTNMALVDPIPAGLEVLNPELATAVDVPPEEHGDLDRPGIPFGGSWWGTWFDHQNQRDDRAEAFAGYLPAGTYRYSYVARATTPGDFVVPPAKAEELYSPEVFGRSAGDQVAVVD